MDGTTVEWAVRTKNMACGHVSHVSTKRNDPEASLELSARKIWQKHTPAMPNKTKTPKYLAKSRISTEREHPSLKQMKISIYLVTESAPLSAT